MARGREDAFLPGLTSVWRCGPGSCALRRTCTHHTRQHESMATSQGPHREQHWGLARPSPASAVAREEETASWSANERCAPCVGSGPSENEGVKRRALKDVSFERNQQGRPHSIKSQKKNEDNMMCVCVCVCVCVCAADTSRSHRQPWHDYPRMERNNHLNSIQHTHTHTHSHTLSLPHTRKGQ